MRSEFDYQWKNLPSRFIEYNSERVDEFLRFTGIESLKGKKALDAGCGNGRYTYAMQQLGATVDSIDISIEAVKACRKINPNAKQISVLDVSGNYDFILSWGVLHHMENPYAGFKKLISVLKKGGMIHLMLYHKDTQKQYVKLRKEFNSLNEKERIDMCKRLGKNIHGWYDALNPKFNYSFDVDEIIKWFKDSKLTDIKVISTHNININGIK